MTFLTMLVSELDDEQLTKQCNRCVIHPVIKHECTHTKADKYTADMEILLTFYSLLDHQKDHDVNQHKSFSKQLEKYIPELEKRYPKQTKAITDNLDLLDEGEKVNSQEPEKMSRYFGALLGAIFTPYSDNWATELYAIGEGLGRFIYLSDAYIDLKKDLKKNKYNPFKTLSTEDNFEAQVMDLLSWAAADAAKAFEYLPLDEHCTILQNILYSGIWSQIEVNKKK